MTLKTGVIYSMDIPGTSLSPSPVSWHKGMCSLWCAVLFYNVGHKPLPWVCTWYSYSFSEPSGQWLQRRIIQETLKKMALNLFELFNIIFRGTNPFSFIIHQFTMLLNYIITITSTVGRNWGTNSWLLLSDHLIWYEPKDGAYWESYLEDSKGSSGQPEGSSREWLMEGCESFLSVSWWSSYLLAVCGEFLFPFTNEKVKDHFHGKADKRWSPRIFVVSIGLNSMFSCPLAAAKVVFWPSDFLVSACLWVALEKCACSSPMCWFHFAPLSFGNSFIEK